MAHLKKVNFSHVKKEEGCMCDNCGQWITNIVTVTFEEGESLHFGVDCYEKRISGKLNSFGKKEMNKVLKTIKEHDRLLAELKSGKDTALVLKQWESYRYWQGYWNDKSIDEWKSWMINDVIPKWIEKDEKEFERFRKINF